MARPGVCHWSSSRKKNRLNSYHGTLGPTMCLTGAMSLSILTTTLPTGTPCIRRLRPPVRQGLNSRSEETASWCDFTVVVSWSRCIHDSHGADDRRTRMIIRRSRRLTRYVLPTICATSWPNWVKMSASLGNDCSEVQRHGQNCARRRRYCGWANATPQLASMRLVSGRSP